MFTVLADKIQVALCNSKFRVVQRGHLVMVVVVSKTKFDFGAKPSANLKWEARARLSYPLFLPVALYQLR